MLLPVPGDAMLDGEKVAVTPFGNPLTDSRIDDLKPLMPAVDTESGIEPPVVKTASVAPGVSEKLGVATVIASGWVSVIPPPTDFTVRL